jgi:hypothetical protein
MSSIKDRLSTLFEQVAVRIVAGVIVAFIVPILAIVFGADFSQFFRTRIETSVLVISILSLFALVGVLSTGSTLWRLVDIQRVKDSKPFYDIHQIHSTSGELLRSLSRVQAGLQLRYKHEVSEFSAKVLSEIDSWETALMPLLYTEDIEILTELRDEVASAHLPQSKEKSKQWIDLVKGMRSKVLNRSKQL